MHKIYEVFGLLEDADEAEATIRDLAEHGVPADQIEVIVPEAGTYPLADEHLHQDLVGGRHGALGGGLAGVVVGLLVVMASSTFTPLSAPGILLAAGFGGFGATVGGVVGMMRRDAGDDDEAMTRAVLAPGAARLVAVRSDDRVGRAHRVLEQHGALFLDAPHPLPKG